MGAKHPVIQVLYYTMRREMCPADRATIKSWKEDGREAQVFYYTMRREKCPADRATIKS